MDEALQLVNDVIGFLDGEAAVKSGTARKIGSITAVRAPQTIALKSADGEDIAVPDTAAYIFNFADSAGFALISGDTRVDASILGYSENGTLSDTLDNPGLMLFLEGAEEYIAQSIVEAERQKDSLINDILAKLIADEGLPETKTTTTTIEDIGDYRITTSTTRDEWLTLPQRVGPLLPVQWAQGAPFNDLMPGCSNRNDGHAPAGCIAVATAQIMAYHKSPAGFALPGDRLYSYDWNLLTSYTFGMGDYYNVSGKTGINTNSTLPRYLEFKKQASRLLQQIGYGESMIYACILGSSFSFTWFSYAEAFLKRVGYIVGNAQGYDVNTILTSLQQNQPVFVYGTRRKISWFGISSDPEWSGGHAWVLDGYLQRRRGVRISGNVTRISTGYVITGIGSTTYEGETLTYIHNNWGWGNNKNGYFIAYCFNTNETQLASDTKSDTPDDYKYGVGIYPYIHVSGR
jgi:hypothetical protein